MAEGKIPPPHINFKRKDLDYSEEMAFINNESNFREYLTKSKEEVDKERQRIEDEERDQEAKLKAAIKQEELQEEIEIQKKLDEAKLEEELGVEQEEESEEKLFLKGQQGKSKKTKGQKNFKGSLKDIEEEETRLIKDNQIISEEGEELEVSLEDDPLKAMQEEVGQEEEAFVKKLKDSKSSKHEKSQKTEKPSEKKGDKKTSKKDSKEKTEASKSQKSGLENVHEETVAANLSATKSDMQTPQTIAKSKASAFKSKELEDLEKMAMQLISEADVLVSGDVIETTVRLNLEESIFDQGEVTVTAYKYAPLQVNLKFKKFKHDATKLMQKNSKELKNILQRKSLKVHQLEITEE